MNWEFQLVLHCLSITNHFLNTFTECQNVSRVAASPNFSLIQSDASRCKKSQEPAW